jgi:hypothetical protein
LGPDAEGSADRRLFFDPSSFVRALRWVLDGPPQQERVVSGCNGCPALGEDHGCGPCESETDYWCGLADEEIMLPTLLDGGGRPDWCPLREGPIVLRLAE